MSADPLIGSVICDRFEIRSKIGQGGMGSVYLAWQRSVQREVAIKLIDGASPDDDQVRRFEREARLASQLAQPNTVSIFDFGQSEDGRFFIAMELIRGRTLLKVMVAEGVFAIERAVRVGSQICDALEAAHGLGIVHRDLKLENVMLLDEPAGRDLVKVLDFGLARLYGDASSSGKSPAKISGTPRYIAPEAATRGTIGPEADVYALGVMIGELVTGKPLWISDELTELIHEKLHPERAIALVPAAARRIVGGMIAADPKARPNAAQARALLRSLADGSLTFPSIDLRAQRPAPRVTRRPELETPPASEASDSSRAWWAIVAVLAAIAAIAFALAR